MIELGDEFSESSSFMPQKKNPIPLTVVRALASSSVGYIASALSLMRTSSQDFDKSAFQASAITITQQVNDATAYLSAGLASLQAHPELMRERARSLGTTLSEIPTLIVQKTGLDWRSAHWIVERAVRLALERSLKPSQLTTEILDEAAVTIVDHPLNLSATDIQNALDPSTFINTRQTAGSVNPRISRDMLKVRRGTSTAQKEWLTGRRAALAAARHRLDSAVRSSANSVAS